MNSPSCIIHRTIIPDNITDPIDIITYVSQQQQISNSLIEVFDYYGYNSSHNNIISLVDLWMGFRVDQNSTVSGGTININNVVYELGQVLEHDDNITYWRASVEPGQFNIYNIDSVNLNLRFNSQPDGKLYSSYGMISKGTTIDSHINTTYTYAFSTINLDAGEYLGVTHSLLGVNNILYKDGKLGYDTSNYGTCIEAIYGVYVPKYYIYAYNYAEFIYNNNNRTPTFLGGNNDLMKSQGKHLEVMNSYSNISILGNKFIDDNILYSVFTVKFTSGLLLGISDTLNIGINKVMFSNNGIDYYDCCKLQDSFVDVYNNNIMDTYWRISHDPIIFALCLNANIYFKIQYTSTHYIKYPVIYSIGYPKSNLSYSGISLNKNPIFINSVNDNVQFYYNDNNLIKYDSNNIEQQNIDIVYIQLTDITSLYYYSANIISYLQATRTIVT
jgi:hypothetical protein